MKKIFFEGKKNSQGSNMTSILKKLMNQSTGINGQGGGANRCSVGLIMSIQVFCQLPPLHTANTAFSRFAASSDNEVILADQGVHLHIRVLARKR